MLESPVTETTRIRKIGNSHGIILSRDLLQELKVKEGDELFVVRTADGIQLSSYDPDFAEALRAGREYMDEHRDALRELAK